MSKTFPVTPTGTSCGRYATRKFCCRDTVPLCGKISPLISLSKVDLPMPLRPSKPTHSPCSICRLISSNNRGPPKPRLTSCKLTNAINDHFHEKFGGSSLIGGCHLRFFLRFCSPLEFFSSTKPKMQ